MKLKTNNKYKKSKILYIITYVSLFLLILFIIFDLFITLSNKNKIFSDINILPSKEYCLLLGTSKYTRKNTENLFYRYRIDAVKELYNKNYAKKIIISGDNRVKSYNETKYMKNDLIKGDIPQEALIIDSDGFRTIWSISNLFSKYRINEAIVVSQKFHLERAIFIGKIFGLNLIGYTAKPVYGISGLKIQIRERGARLRLLLDLFQYLLNKKEFLRNL